MNTPTLLPPLSSADIRFNTGLVEIGGLPLGEEDEYFVFFGHGHNEAGLYSVLKAYLALVDIDDSTQREIVDTAKDFGPSEVFALAYDDSGETVFHWNDVFPYAPGSFPLTVLRLQ